MPDEDLPGGDMTACMNMMQEDGYTEDEAARICESLKAEAEADHGNVDELRESIRRGAGLIADVGVELNSAVDKPAINSKWVMFKSAGTDAPDGKNTQIDAPLVLKESDDADARDEKRIAYAPAMIPRELDKEGDVVPTPTVEGAAHDYLKSDGGADSDHDLIDGKGEPVESWILPEQKTWDLPEGGQETYPAGTWMVGIEWDKETWKRIREGELEGLSIYGRADHVELGKSAPTAKAFEVPFAAETVVHVIYESRTAAEKASDAMGLDGAVHEHEFDGMDVYMPGETHDEFVQAYMDMAEESEMPVSMAGKAEDDPCWDGYTMVGTDSNGDPRCVPDDDVPDATGFENAVSMDGSGPPAGTTPNNGAAESTKQESQMAQNETVEALESRLDTVEASIEDVADTVESVKDAVDTDKQPGASQGDSALRSLAAELASHDDVGQSAEDIIADLKSTYLDDKANDGMDDDEDDDEEKTDGDAGTGADETAKSDAAPNYGKGADGGDAAVTAKDTQEAGAGEPSYAALTETYEEN